MRQLLTGKHDAVDAGRSSIFISKGGTRGDAPLASASSTFKVDDVTAVAALRRDFGLDRVATDAAGG